MERILKHRRRGCGYQYYVQWEGYPITEASWELVTHWHSISRKINFLETNLTEMTCINDAMWDIMDIFDDIYFELYLILLAIELDDIPSLLASPPPQDFDPF